MVASDSGGEGAVVRSDVTADGAGGSVAGTSTLLDTMRVVSALALPEPQLSDLSQDQRRMLQVGCTGGPYHYPELQLSRHVFFTS